MKEGLVKDCIVLSRDHHDVSGTDSPFRETSNIYDGSAFTAGIVYYTIIDKMPKSTYSCLIFFQPEKTWRYKIVSVTAFEVRVYYTIYTIYLLLFSS